MSLFPLSECGEDCKLFPLTPSVLCSGDAGGDLGYKHNDKIIDKNLKVTKT